MTVLKGAVAHAQALGRFSDGLALSVNCLQKRLLLQGQFPEGCGQASALILLDITALNIRTGVFQQADEGFAVPVPGPDICRHVARQAAQAFAPAVLPFLVHVGLDKSRETCPGGAVVGLNPFQESQTGILKGVAIRNLKRHARERVEFLYYGCSLRLMTVQFRLLTDQKTEKLPIQRPRAFKKRKSIGGGDVNSVRGVCVRGYLYPTGGILNK